MSAMLLPCITPARPRRERLITKVILNLVLLGTAQGFEPGAVCNDFALGANVSVDQMLSGRHLTIGDIHWSGVAEYNASLVGNAAWSGWDVEFFKNEVVEKYCDPEKAMLEVLE